MCDWEFPPSKFVWEALEREGALSPEDGVIKIEPKKLYQTLLELDVFCSNIFLNAPTNCDARLGKIEESCQQLTEKIDFVGQQVELLKKEQNGLQNWHMVDDEE